MRYLTLIVCLLVSGLSAQPGYRGKKVVIKYQPSINMNFPGVSSSGKDRPYLANAIYHGLNMEYVVGRRTTIGGYFARCKNYVNLGNYVDPYYNDKEYFTYSKLVDRKLEFVVKHFRKNRGNLAPLGTYTQFGLSKHWYDVSSVKYNEVLYANSNIYGFSIAWGKQRIYRNSVVFDINLKLEIDIPYVDLFPDGNVSTGIMRNTELYVFAQNVIGLNLGIGFLAPRLGKK